MVDYFCRRQQKLHNTTEISGLNIFRLNMFLFRCSGESAGVINNIFEILSVEL